MTATALPPTASNPTDGFSSDAAPDTAPTPAQAVPSAPAATTAPAAPATTAAPSLIAAAANAPKYEFKADGMHADDLKAFGDVLGEHKVDGKVGQAILDKMLPALSSRREAEVKAKWEETQKGWRDENAKDPTIDPSKPENQARTKLALEIAGADVLEDLKAKGLTDLPAFNRLVARFGAFVEKATKQDTAVPGASPSAAPQFEAGNQSDKAWSAGMGIGF